jgi:hypothetical protein
MQYSDAAYNFWKQKNGRVISIVLTMSGLFSFKIFRLLYSRLFSAKFFSAQFDNPMQMTKRV